MSNEKLIDALTRCAEYLECIPESAAGGDDDAQTLAKKCRDEIEKQVCFGMSLRDYFAAKAMACIPQKTSYNMKDKESDEAYTARCAYVIADAMLKARK